MERINSNSKYNKRERERERERGIGEDEGEGKSTCAGYAFQAFQRRLSDFVFYNLERHALCVPCRSKWHPCRSKKEPPPFRGGGFGEFQSRLLRVARLAEFASHVPLAKTKTKDDSFLGISDPLRVFGYLKPLSPDFFGEPAGVFLLPNPL